MSILGSVCAPLIGFGSTYTTEISLPWFHSSALVWPGLLQLLIVLISFCWFLSVFPRFYRAANSDREILAKPAEPKLEEIYREEDVIKIKYMMNALRHWGVFSGLFSVLVLRFSVQIRDVAIPILMYDHSPAFSTCSISETWGLRGIYALYFAGALAGFLIRELYQLLVDRVWYDRTMTLLIFLCAGVGWGLLVHVNTIPLIYLVSGFILTTLNSTALHEASYNLYHKVLGPKSEGFYVNMFLALGGMGAMLGPLWAKEALAIDCGLCFGFVEVWIGIMVIILVTAWGEAIPYDVYMKNYMEKIPKKQRVEAA